MQDGEYGVDQQLVVLLDLNYTFVASSPKKRRQGGTYRDKIKLETYRTWLIPLFIEANAKVHLVTVRQHYYERDTARAIGRFCDGWQPDGYHFNPGDSADARTAAPAHKRKVLRRAIVPLYGEVGSEGVRYLALESNAATRAMYVREGVPVWRITWDDDRKPWTALPHGVLAADQRVCSTDALAPTGRT